MGRTAVAAIDLHEVKNGDGIQIKDNAGNVSTGPVVIIPKARMLVHVFGFDIVIARWSSKAGRTRVGDWVPVPGVKVVGHQPAMF